MLNAGCNIYSKMHPFRNQGMKMEVAPSLLPLVMILATFFCFLPLQTCASTGRQNDYIKLEASDCTTDLSLSLFEKWKAEGREGERETLISSTLQSPSRLLSKKMTKPCALGPLLSKKIQFSGYLPRNAKKEVIAALLLDF